MLSSPIKTSIYKLCAILILGGALAFGIILLHFTLAEANITIYTRAIPIAFEEEVNIPISSKKGEDKPIIDVLPVTAPLTPKNEIDKLRKEVLTEEKLQPSNNTASFLSAEVIELPMSFTHKTTPEGESTTVEETATGVVTIFNEMNFPQQLVAKTRLLTSEGVLFRIKEGVVAPSKGNVQVEVAADPLYKGQKSNIPAGTMLTIPGLSASRQTQVYAKNTDPFKGGVRVIKTISEKDIARAKIEAQEKLQEYAVEQFNKQGHQVIGNEVYISDITLETNDMQGEQKPYITTLAHARAFAVFIPEDKLLETTHTILNDKILKNQNVVSFNDESFTYTIKEVNENINQVLVKIYLEAFTAIDGDGKGEAGDIIDKKKLVGLNARQIQAQMLKNELIDSVQVNFSPFWVTRAPRRLEKINVVLISK